VSLKLIQQILEPFHLFLLLQDNSHHDGLKCPRPRDHHTGLDMQFGAIKEPIEEGLIGFGQCFFERVWSKYLNSLAVRVMQKATETFSTQTQAVPLMPCFGEGLRSGLLVRYLGLPTAIIHTPR
jgi:hypothetical protein